MRRVVTGVAVLATIAIAWTGRGGFTPVDSGTLAPAFSAPSLGGDTIDIGALRGQVVVLNVWTTWCRPCVAEMAALERLYERNRASGLVVVGVNIDDPVFLREDLVSAVREFVEKHDLTFPIALDPGARIVSSYPVLGLPMTFVIDRDGRIAERVIGEREWDLPEWESRIRRLLES